MRLLRCLVAAAVPALAAGCTSSTHVASLQDNFGTDVFAAFVGNPNGLSTPYVEGSKFTITVQPGGSADSAGWVLKSSDPTVMTVTGPTNATQEWPVTAVGAGHATLTVVDANGKVLDSEGIDVDVPTNVELCAEGLLLTGFTDTQAQVSSIRVVSGGTATFLARYYNGTQELAGNNALKPTGSGIATATTVAANFSVRDFLEVSATDMGSGSVTLGVGSTDTPVSVEAVDPSAVATVGLFKQDDSHAKKGDTLYVYGRAGDGQGNDIFGGSFSWNVNGVPLPAHPMFIGGPTDLVTYQFDPGQVEVVGDGLGKLSASAQVQGAPATTAEASTENVGCSVARGAGAGGGAGVAGVGLLAAAVALSRRRCRSRRTRSGRSS